jgi:DNA-binding transcriptional MerR regulator
MMKARRYEIVLCRDASRELTLDALAARAGVHPGLIDCLVEVGLIAPLKGAPPRFDAAAVPRLRMILRLRENLGINLAGIAVVLDLIDKVCELQRQIEVQGSTSQRFKG